MSAQLSSYEDSTLLVDYIIYGHHQRSIICLWGGGGNKILKHAERQRCWWEVRRRVASSKGWLPLLVFTNSLASRTGEVWIELKLPWLGWFLLVKMKIIIRAECNVHTLRACGKHADTCLWQKKKNPQGDAWCTESGLSAAREEIPHLDKSVSWAVSRWEAEESAALLDCWPAVRFWSDAEPQSAWWRAREALAASGGVCLHLHPPITPLYASSVNTHTHARTPDQIRSSRPKLRRQLAWCVCTQKKPALPALVELGAHGLGSTCNGEM